MSPKSFSHKITVLLVVLFSMTMIGYAQVNPEVISRELIKNQSDTLVVTSYGPISIPILPKEDLNYKWHLLDGSENQYELIYTPSEDYLGFDQAQLQYRVIGTNNQFPVKYSTIVYEVVNSILNVEDDYYTVNQDEYNSFLVLDNDNTTGAFLDITNIASTTHGEAYIIHDGNTNGPGIKIGFTPEEGYTGMAYVNYVVNDNYGTSQTGIVHINVLPGVSNTNEVINITADNENSLLITLDNDDFGINSFTNDYGDIDIDESFMTFLPFTDEIGMDTLILGNNEGDTKTYYINVISLDNDYGFVRDDIFYSSIDNTIEFDVFLNDIKQNYPIIDYSEELVEGSSEGLFSYTPENGFIGKKSFFYTVWNGFESEQGNIDLFFSDYSPKALLQYQFDAIKNTPILMEYTIPIQNTHFEIANNPMHGTLEYIASSDSLVLGCDVISTERSVVYYPDNNFVGDDEFEVEYCIDGQNDCQIIKVSVSIIDEEEDCHCIDDCVWAGDANNDGKVRVDDLLAIAYNIGQEGNSRDEIDYGSWYGQSSTDWSENIFNEKLNTKYSDSDGNGLVDIADTIGLAENYTQYHSLLQDDLLSVSDFPFILIPHSTSLDSGDVLVIDIAIGNEYAQVIDLHGLAFSMNLGANLVDSASLKINFFDNSWLVSNTPSVQMSKTPIDGYVEAAISRIGNSSANGYGIIGQSVCIIEEDLDDVRFGADTKSIALKITLNNASAIDGNGNRIKLPNASTEVKVNLTKKENTISSDDKLLLYPNPVSNLLNVHLNGQDLIQDIMIYDVAGRMLFKLNNVNHSKHALNTATYENGIYIMKVHTSIGIINKKFEVFK